MRLRTCGHILPTANLEKQGAKLWNQIHRDRLCAELSEEQHYQHQVARD